jgi:hypothetical protein
MESAEYQAIDPPLSIFAAGVTLRFTRLQQCARHAEERTRQW